MSLQAVTSMYATTVLPSQPIQTTLADCLRGHSSLPTKPRARCKELAETDDSADNIWHVFAMLERLLLYSTLIIAFLTVGTRTAPKKGWLLVP